MGAHSNYVSVESDFTTFIYLILSILVLTIAYFAFKLIKSLIKRHYYKQFRTEQHNVEQYKQIKARKERAYQNTINNFFYNRIQEDIEEISGISKSSSKQSKDLISLYNFEV